MSFRNPRESSAGHRAGLISDVAASSGEEVDSNNETALPPFQSAVETSGGYRINPGDEGTVPMAKGPVPMAKGLPPLPTPPRRPSSMAYVASAPAYPTAPVGPAVIQPVVDPTAAMASAGAAVLPPSMTLAGGIVACVVGSAVSYTHLTLPTIYSV